MAAAAMPGAIQVAVRVRPLVPRELSEGATQGLEVDEVNSCVTALGSRQTQARRFTFDHVLGPSSAKVGGRADVLAATTPGLAQDPRTPEALPPSLPDGRAQAQLQ